MILLRQYEKEMLDAFLTEDDMDFHYNKVKCWRIEGMLVKVVKMMKMVKGEVRSMR